MVAILWSTAMAKQKFPLIEWVPWKWGYFELKDDNLKIWALQRGNISIIRVQVRAWPLTLAANNFAPLWPLLEIS